MGTAWPFWARMSMAFEYAIGAGRGAIGFLHNLCLEITRFDARKKGGE